MSSPHTEDSQKKAIFEIPSSEESFTPSETSEKYEDATNSDPNASNNGKKKREGSRKRRSGSKTENSKKSSPGSSNTSTRNSDSNGNIQDDNKVNEKIQTDAEYLERVPSEHGDYPAEQALIPKRHVLLLMIFLGFVNIYAMRVNLNVAIVAMVNNKTVILPTGEVKKYPAEFHWNSRVQGIVVASFYYGYWVLQIPGAWIAMRIGGTKIFGYGVFLSALLSILTPVATRYSVYALITIRILQGLFLGVTFPSNHAIWAKWSPALERSTLVTMAIAGCPVGNILAIPITGMLAKYGFDGGWPSVFYCFGIFALLWYAAWEYMSYDSPANHPTITKAERFYIENSIGGNAFDPMKEKPPWKEILTSVPMWGITVGHFGACWGYYTLFTQMPTYLKDIQHLDIKTMGFVAAVPYLLKSFVGPIGGISADILIKRKLLTVRGVRALFYGAGCLLAGSCILATGYCAAMEDAIAFLILGIGFSGLNATGYAVNHLDIAPRYAGILMGLSNTFATIPGFLSPMLTGMIAKHKKASEWRVVFWITFIVYVVATGLYSIMCAGEQQPWADPASENAETTALSEEPTRSPNTSQRTSTTSQNSRTK
ncbi:uncharacterized transporter slc-17.2-like [Rhopilema esculentum]|uniref:uncharacterized transporter slc-17.2-like n=1 Tax=Rhopilema esculentum TaxID=499914 RepID=UPI0031D25331|eukprot:gene12397-3055_t